MFTWNIILLWPPSNEFVHLCMCVIVGLQEMKMKVMFLLQNKTNFLLLTLVFYISLTPHNIDAISAYWTPILPQVCSANVSKNITQALYACDNLMDDQLSKIFDECVRLVNQLKDDKLTKPKLCYYLKMGIQLDRCKMAKYQSEGITLPELVDREQDHTWCLMKIAQPLGWERLCSDHPNDFTFLMTKQNSIQICEQRFKEITNPIRECFNEQVLPQQQSTVSGHLAFGSTAFIKSNFHHRIKQQKQTTNTIPNSNSNSNDKYKPAACLSFQYSRKIWKCLAEKDREQTMQRRANMYINCLRSIRQR